MKKSKFSDSQIIEALKRVEGGLSVSALCRELGIGSATFYKWRAKYGGLDVSMMARMKELEAGNARHEEDVRRGAPEGRYPPGGDYKKVVRPSHRREMAKKAVGERGVSIRIACQVFELNLRIKPRKRLVRERPEPLAVPTAINQVWSMDFMHDQLEDGRCFRLFNVIDDFNRASRSRTPMSSVSTAPYATNDYPSITGRISTRSSSSPPSGCTTTIMTAQTWPWAALHQNSDWPWPRSSTSDRP